MDIPFTIEQFLGVFRDYNHSIWPAQIGAYLLGILAILAALKRTRNASRLVSLILAALWMWMGLVYHMAFFSEINPAAYVFGAFFVVQGLLFLVTASGRMELKFEVGNDVYGMAGGILMAYALIAYPVVGAALGHAYPFAPMFGVAPCPTTIFTFGLLLWTRQGVSRWLFLIPGLWSVVGFSAALKLGMREDIGLIVAAIISIGLVFQRRKSELSFG